MHSAPLATILDYPNFLYSDEMVKEYMEVLEGWDCDTFIKEILNDKDIEQLMYKVVDAYKRILCKYSQVENSPDGIQAITFCDDFYGLRLFNKDLVLVALLDAKISVANSKFINIVDDTMISRAALQKPYKMIQIANALLPPDILSKDNLSLYPNLIEHDWRENDLIQPNSFYVQAYIYENCINFILNKVIAVSSIDNAVQKSTFTIQEKNINIENIINTACDILWNHFQSLDFEDHSNSFSRNCCYEHSDGEFDVENYFNFKANLKILMSNWVSITQKGAI